MIQVTPSVTSKVLHNFWTIDSIRYNGVKIKGIINLLSSHLISHKFLVLLSTLSLSLYLPFFPLSLILNLLLPILLPSSTLLSLSFSSYFIANRDLRMIFQAICSTSWDNKNLFHELLVLCSKATPQYPTFSLSNVFWL